MEPIAVSLPTRPAGSGCPTACEELSRQAGGNPDCRFALTVEMQVEEMSRQ